METNNDFKNKLIILMVFDCMNVSLTKETLIDIVTENEWIDLIYIDSLFLALLKAGLIIKKPKDKKNSYILSADGRQCLISWQEVLPAAQRNEIKQKIDKDRLNYRLKGDYFADYNKASDGTYNVQLVIRGASEPILDIRLNVSSRNKAKWIYETWPTKAFNIHETIFDLLND